MKHNRKVALFAPIKPPDHPIPSGDRLIARNLVKAMELGGNQVELASRYKCYSKRSAPDILAERKSGALEEAERIIADYSGRRKSELPSVWITYHPYCKAPDWIGPKVSKALGIPYVTIEAARTGQGGPEDEWGPWRAEAQPLIKQADLHIVFKPSDQIFLTDLLGSDEKLRNMAPFVDLESLENPIQQTVPASWSGKPPVLVTAGMMRKGKKDRNFYMLAEILSGAVSQDWNLVVVGGGPEEEQIREAFSGIPEDRIHWTGEVEHKEVLGWMQAGDLFMWPGWKEPIGMVYLEAQSQNLPVLAYQSMGVPLVVEHGVTGLLAQEDDMEGMRENLTTLLKDRPLRTRMGTAGRSKVRDDHSIEAASARLNEILSEFDSTSSQ